MATPKELIKKFGYLQTGLFVAIIIILFYSSFNSQYVPTIRKDNVTDAQNNTVLVTKIYSYTYDEYVLQDKNFESENPQIPKGAFELETVLLLIVLLSVFAFFNLKNKDSFDEPLPIEKIEELTKIYMQSQKDQRKIKDYQLVVGADLTYRRIGESKSLPYRWNQPVDVTAIDGIPGHRLVQWQPYKGFFINDLKIDKEFTKNDTCGNCGRFGDEHIITPDEYTKWHDLFGTK